MPTPHEEEMRYLAERQAAVLPGTCVTFPDGMVIDKRPVFTSPPPIHYPTWFPSPPNVAAPTTWQPTVWPNNAGAKPR